jgi:hypothetical protein
MIEGSKLLLKLVKFLDENHFREAKVLITIDGNFKQILIKRIYNKKEKKSSFGYHLLNIMKLYVHAKKDFIIHFNNKKITKDDLNKLKGNLKNLVNYG